VEHRVADLVQPPELVVPQRFDRVALAAHARTLEHRHLSGVVGIGGCCHPAQAEPFEGRTQEDASGRTPDALTSDFRTDDVADDTIGAGGVARLSGTVDDVEEPHAHDLPGSLDDT
jgi:hypothetical protein